MRYPLRSPKFEGVELGRSLEVPVALAEVEGTKPGGVPAAVVISGGV